MTAITDSHYRKAAGEWHIVRLIDRTFMVPLDRALENMGVWRIAVTNLLLLQFVLIVGHQPWLDESQALMIALQPDSLSSLAAQLPYEGHPPLWYLLLRAIGQVVPAIWVMPIANLLLAMCVDWAVLVRAPFSRAEKLSLLLSEFVLIEYLAISRSLTLGATFLFLALALWRSRGAWLCIAALPLCDFFFGVISIILIAFRFNERGTNNVAIWTPGLILWLLLSLGSAWTVIPARDIVTEPIKGFPVDTIIFLQQLGTILFPWQTSEYGPMWNGYPPMLLGIFLSPLFVALCYLVARTRPIYLASLFGFILILCAFRTGVYPIYYRHTSLVGALIIAICWIRGYQASPIIREVRAWLVSTSLCGLASAAVMLTTPFDTARAAARKIEALNLQDALWFSYPDYRSISLTTALGRPIVNPETRCSFTFVRWNYETKLKRYADFAKLARENIHRFGKHYIITTFPFSVIDPKLLNPVAQIPAGYDGQPYYLWEVGPDAPLKTMPRPPPCVPGLRPLSEVLS